MPLRGLVVTAGVYSASLNSQHHRFLKLHSSRSVSEKNCRNTRAPTEPIAASALVGGPSSIIGERLPGRTIRGNTHVELNLDLLQAQEVIECKVRYVFRLADVEYSTFPLTPVSNGRLHAHQWKAGRRAVLLRDEATYWGRCRQQAIHSLRSVAAYVIEPLRGLSESPPGAPPVRPVWASSRTRTSASSCRPPARPAHRRTSPRWRCAVTMVRYCGWAMSPPQPIARRRRWAPPRLWARAA